MKRTTMNMSTFETILSFTEENFGFGFEALERGIRYFPAEELFEEYKAPNEELFLTPLSGEGGALIGVAVEHSYQDVVGYASYTGELIYFPKEMIALSAIKTSFGGDIKILHWEEEKGWKTSEGDENPCWKARIRCFTPEGVEQIREFRVFPDDFLRGFTEFGYWNSEEEDENGLVLIDTNPTATD